MSRQAKKIVVVGGVAGGMSAAARLRRLSEHSQIVVFEKSGHVSFANCGLPYYIGREIENHDALLLQTPDSLKQRLNIDVHVNHEVVAIDTGAKTVTVRNLMDQHTFQERYDELILSVGAAPIKPAVGGIDLPGLFALRTVEDVDAVDEWIERTKPTTAVVAGGGYIGLETAEQLRRRGLRVTVVERNERLLKQSFDAEMSELIHKELRANAIDLLLGSAIEGFEPPKANVAGEPGAAWVLAQGHPPIHADLVILGLGVNPEIKLAKLAGLEIGQRGGIRVDDYLQTSVPHVWAVGDVIEVMHPIAQEYTKIALGGPANRQGRIVANNIFGAREKYNGTLGTAIVRVFDLVAASTGLNQDQIERAGIPFYAVHVHPTHHAGYYPGAERLAMKVLFRKDNGKLLGAQVVGRDGVDKRIDVIATALKAGMTIEDLADLELAYAPPFGSAKDAINLAGMAGRNLLDGTVAQLDADELPALNAQAYFLLDVRSPGEFRHGALDGAKNIPLPDLRKHLAEIPSDKKIIVYCQSGQRSYMAARILMQNGYNVMNLSGGYLSWVTTPRPQVSQSAVA